MAVSPTNRRSTLTVPATTLETAKRLAHKRKVTLNVVVNEALEAHEPGLRWPNGDELLLVNGIHVRERKGRRRR